MPADQAASELIALTRLVRDLYEYFGMLANDVAAMHDTVRVLDPSFDETMARKREEAARLNAEKLQSKISELDGIIQRLRE